MISQQLACQIDPVGKIIFHGQQDERNFSAGPWLDVQKDASANQFLAT
jgi:hypothetical protein